MSLRTNSQLPTANPQVQNGLLGIGNWVLGVVICALATVGAQAQDMPDPSLIHGRAIPAPELAAGTVTVRVVREAIGNNIAGQEVRVTVGGTTRTATTDELGRAEFTGLPAGEAKAAATVDGEALESQPFPVPTSGGLRVILVAGMARAAERRKQEEAAAAAAPAVKGQVVLGGNTRIIMEFNDDVLRVFYLLDVVNNARARVDIGAPLVIDLPEEAAGATAMEGSSPQASVAGDRLTITGPFASGSTSVQIGYTLDYGADSEYTFSQAFPAALQQVTVAIMKVANVGMASPQFATVNDVKTEDGQTYVLASGPGLQAGTPLTINLTGLPAHSRTPLWAALGIAAAVAGIGIWLSVSGGKGTRETQAALIRRRDSLLAELAQLESKHRAGTVPPDRYASRRQRLIADLEQIYGELDSADAA